MTTHSPNPPNLPAGLLQAGEPLPTARAAALLVHGRGADAHDIMQIGQYLATSGLYLLAPQAPSNNTWYPYSFLEPMEKNEPYLSQALATMALLVDWLGENGLPSERLLLLGFSQGACLTTEFVARNARRYGAVVGFSGGLIGPPGTPREYAGSLAGTPVLLGCSDVDFHIPVERVHETTEVLRGLGAEVDERIYPGMGHMVNEDELAAAQALVAQLLAE